MSAAFSSDPAIAPVSAIPDPVSSTIRPSVPEAAAALAPRLLAQAPHSDHEGGFPVQEFNWLREAGLLKAPLPAASGGAGLADSPHTFALLHTLKHIGRGNLAVGRVFEGHANALQLMQRFGKPAQVRRWAADAQAGHLFGVWNTEAQDGVKLEPLPDGRYRLQGSKTFASGAGHVTRPLLTAALPDGGWQMLILPADVQQPVLDTSFWRPLGMRASASFRADFSGLEIGSEDLLGQPGDYYRQPWFSGGAIRFAAVQLGGAEAVFDETRYFLQRIGRTDDPYQRQRLGEMALLIENGNLWLRGAADHAVRPTAETQPEATVAYANMVRTAVEDICLRVLQLAERCVGARGLLRPEPFERLHRDLTHYLRQPAPDAAQADAGRFALAHSIPAYRLWHV
ncbi:acyl-CoA dehydrogenase family protein [Hymenobacter psychrotolerans]|uniref:Acyl-CoA dehydrogenase n=1 Tax=Hymenobacter psychrotolerans DSM 18569 TaxID=1121959 RepID=A0A1M6YPU3_9BACT|nr:acyl-CoA dehydrogenase family protein [Hymenobacter psychrotolerans]SHL20276.1 Acyl-CoA dehydrogenase [Hymenobacter psychrotolerans DSM 18569]